MDSHFKSKKYVVITCRIRPGEAPASYLLEGLVHSLLQDLDESRAALDNYIFVIYPMLDPDAVAHGHWKTDLKGKDLDKMVNRARIFSCPGITSVKELVNDLSQRGQLRLFLELRASHLKVGSYLSQPLERCPTMNSDLLRFVKSMSMNSVHFVENEGPVQPKKDNGAQMCSLKFSQRGS